MLSLTVACLPGSTVTSPRVTYSTTAESQADSPDPQREAPWWRRKCGRLPSSGQVVPLEGKRGSKAYMEADVAKSQPKDDKTTVKASAATGAASASNTSKAATYRKST